MAAFPRSRVPSVCPHGVWADDAPQVSALSGQLLLEIRSRERVASLVRLSRRFWADGPARQRGSLRQPHPDSVLAPGRWRWRLRMHREQPKAACHAVAGNAAGPSLPTTPDNLHQATTSPTLWIPRSPSPLGTTSVAHAPVARSQVSPGFPRTMLPSCDQRVQHEIPACSGFSPAGCSSPDDMSAPEALIPSVLSTPSVTVRCGMLTSPDMTIWPAG
jgi:hypothetical protein